MLATPNVATYVGCIGDDEYGRILESSAISDGVNVQYLKDGQTPTGTCAALIVDHDRYVKLKLHEASVFSDERWCAVLSWLTWVLPTNTKRITSTLLLFNNSSTNPSSCMLLVSS